MKLMKPMIIMMTLGSILVYAGMREDRSDFTYQFSQKPVIQAPKTFNELTQRDLASVDKPALPAVQYVALNQANRELINSEWEIMRIVSEEGQEVFNAYLNESDRSIKVDFELLRTSVVQIDKEEEQTYYISLLTDGNTIALFKEFNGGYEVLEARKVASVKPSGAEDSFGGSNEFAAGAGSVQNIPATDPSLNAELVLEKALNPIKTAEVLTGEAISGSATLRGGSIERLSVSLHRGTPNEVSFEMDFAEINDGGQFETLVGEEMVTGILTNSGNEGFRLRFATGPLQGAMLNFVTEETYDQMMIERENQEYERMEAEQSPIAEEIREQQEQFQNERAMKQPAATQAPIYQPVDASSQDNGEYSDEGYEQEEYVDGAQESAQEEVYSDEAEYEQDQGVIQSEVADNGFEF